MSLASDFQKEHQEIYPRLEALLIELSKVKNIPDNLFLLNTVKLTLDYVKDLLEDHFKREEEELFPELKDASRLIEDHKEIRDKYLKLEKSYRELVKDSQQEAFKDLDLKEILLYPGYNLIATITHHAQREDVVINFN